jgi:hypothetical protein
MNINLTAHDILGHLSKNKWHVNKVGDTPTYRLLKYEWETFESICKVFEGRDPKELRYSVEELIKNGHIEQRGIASWVEVRAKQDGEIAFEKGVYVKIEYKEKADNWDNFLKRYWFIVLIIGAIMGKVIEISIEAIWVQKSQKASQSIEVPVNSIIDNDSISSANDKNDSTLTDKH